MPNWCYTRIEFHGKINEIKTLYDLVNDCEKHPEQFATSEYPKVKFGYSWLGYPLIKAGLEDLIDGGVGCRGWVCESEMYSEDDESVAILYVNTAWRPMLKMWDEIIKELKLDSITFAAEGEEKGNEVYEIYDPYGYIDTEIYVDGYLERTDEELFYNISNIIDGGYYDKNAFVEYVNKLFITHFTQLSKAIEFIESFNEKFIDKSSYIEVHEFVRNNKVEEYN